MKKFTIFIMLFLFGAISFSQELNPEVYDGIPETSKSRIFLDNFDNNKYFWIKQSSPSTHQIREGYLFFANDFDLSYTDGKIINFNPDKNFELETRIKFVSGSVERFSGLFWGELIFGDKYFFGFSSMGEYKIVKDIGFQTETISKPTKSELVNQTSGNVMTVRKFNDTYYFFLNKELVQKIPFEALPGKYIGFRVASKSMVQINHLKLYYIN